MEPYAFKFVVATALLIFPTIISAQVAVGGESGTAKQEELLTSMLSFENQIKKAYQSQIISAGQNYDNQTLIPCSKVTETAKNFNGRIETIVQPNNVHQWLSSVEVCLLSVLSKAISKSTRNLESRVNVVEDTLGRYGIYIIEPRFGGQGDELLSRIVRLERQAEENKALQRRLEEQQEEIKMLKKMMMEKAGNVGKIPPNVDIGTESPRAMGIPTGSTLTVNKIVERAKRRTALHLAALNGNAVEVQNLLERGANTEFRDGSSWTALHLASWKGFESVVRLLLDYNATVNARDKFNYTPLHWAAQNGSVVCMSLLLERNANTEARDKNGETPLHKAAWGGRAEAMRTLLDRGANANALSSERYTPLHLASMKGCLECVTVLLNVGADISIKNVEDEDALQLAREYNNLKIVNAIETASKTLAIFNVS